MAARGDAATAPEVTSAPALAAAGQDSAAGQGSTATASTAALAAAGQASAAAQIAENVMDVDADLQSAIVWACGLKAPTVSLIRRLHNSLKDEELENLKKAHAQASDRSTSATAELKRGPCSARAKGSLKHRTCRFTVTLPYKRAVANMFREFAHDKKV